MGHFFSSLFSSKPVCTAEEEAEKNKEKNFEMFKYDGMRAQRTGQNPFAIKCFEQALSIKDDFETMNYLVNSYTAANRLDDAFAVLTRMIDIKPDDVQTLIAHENFNFSPFPLYFFIFRSKHKFTECEGLYQRKQFDDQ